MAGCGVEALVWGSGGSWASSREKQGLGGRKLSTGSRMCEKPGRTCQVEVQVAGWGRLPSMGRTTDGG